MLLGSLGHHQEYIIVLPHNLFNLALEIGFVIDVDLVVIVDVTYILKVESRTIFNCLHRDSDLMSGACESRNSIALTCSTTIKVVKKSSRRGDRNACHAFK